MSESGLYWVRLARNGKNRVLFKIRFQHICAHLRSKVTILSETMTFITQGHGEWTPGQITQVNNRMSNLDADWVWLTLNVTNLGLIKISVSTFWLAEQNCTDTDPKNSQISPIWDQSDQFWMINLSSLVNNKVWGTNVYLWLDEITKEQQQSQQPHFAHT